MGRGSNGDEETIHDLSSCHGHTADGTIIQENGCKNRAALGFGGGSIKRGQKLEYELTFR
jgi:hypothetical protein